MLISVWIRRTETETLRDCLEFGGLTYCDRDMQHFVQVLVPLSEWEIQTESNAGGYIRFKRK